MKYDQRFWLTSTEKHANSFTFRGRVKNDFEEHLPIINSGTILDAGCSMGITTREIAEKYPQCRIVGIDYSFSNIDAATRMTDRELDTETKRRLYFRQGNFYLLENYFPPRTFEAIFCMNNWVNMDSEIGLNAHRMIRRGFEKRLKEKGYLCVSGRPAYSNEAGAAVFQKTKGRLKPVYMSAEFACEDSLRVIPLAFGLQTWWKGGRT